MKDSRLHKTIYYHKHTNLICNSNPKWYLIEDEEIGGGNQGGNVIMCSFDNIFYLPIFYKESGVFWWIESKGEGGV